MSDARSRPHGYGRSEAGSRSDRSGPDGDVQASVSRLERAVDELVTTAREQFSDRATSLLDETSRRLERELDRRQARTTGKAHSGRYDDDPEPEPPRHRERLDTVPRALYRDPAREKIGGVCAGIARYYGMEPWVVRCIAVTGLLFFPTIVFPAYWIAYFVMDKPPGSNGKPSRREARRSRRRSCGMKGARGRHGRDDHRSPAPELGPRFSPRYSLRNVQADLTEVELRLRRMETHVTSGQYELQRELNKIDGGNDGRT